MSVSFHDIRNAPLHFMLGHGHGGTRLIAKLFKHFGGFTGNILNNTEDSAELLEWAYDVVAKMVGNTGKTTNTLKNELVEVVVKVLNAGGKDPRKELCGFKVPEFLFGAPSIIVDVFPNARLTFVDRHPIPHACGRKKSHETTYPDHPSGLHVYPAAYRFRYSGQDPKWDIPEHRKMALIWNYGQYWGSKLPSENVYYVKIENLLHHKDYTIQQYRNFIGADESKTAFPDLDPKRLKMPEDCDNFQANEVWEIVERNAIKYRSSKTHYSSSCTAGRSGKADGIANLRTNGIQGKSSIQKLIRSSQKSPSKALI